MLCEQLTHRRKAVRHPSRPSMGRPPRSPLLQRHSDDRVSGPAGLHRPGGVRWGRRRAGGCGSAGGAVGAAAPPVPPLELLRTLPPRLRPGGRVLGAGMNLHSYRGNINNNSSLNLPELSFLVLFQMFRFTPSFLFNSCLFVDDISIFSEFLPPL